MPQTVVSIGNSEGVIIPNDVKKRSGLKKGSKVEVTAVPGGVMITKAGKKSSNPTPEFFEWLEKFNKQYKGALQELAKK